MHRITKVTLRGSESDEGAQVRQEALDDLLNYVQRVALKKPGESRSTMPRHVVVHLGAFFFLGCRELFSEQGAIFAEAEDLCERLVDQLEFETKEEW